jgi:C4-dicarboxylate transporter DctQ subunit
MKNVFRLILEGIQFAERNISSLGLIATTLLIFAQVLNRYILHFEIMWLNDAALYVFVMSMLIAAGFATFKEGHVRVDVFNEWLVKGRPRAASVYRVALVTTSIVVLCLFLPSAFQFMLRAIQYPEYGTLIRWVNTSWLQIMVFFACMLILLHLLVIFRRDLRELIKILSAKSGNEGK